MSDALSSSEIEDVLSSIRRLVSDDMRPLRAPASGVRPAGDGEKLLLTPALRVVQSDSPETPLAEPGSGAVAIDAVVLSVSAGIDRQGEDWESETGDLAPDAAGDMVAEFGAEFDAEIAPMAEDVLEGSWQDQSSDAYAEPIRLRPLSDQGFSATIADVPEAERVREGAVSEGALAEVLQDGLQDQYIDDAHDAAADDEPTDDLAPDPWKGATIEPDRAWADEAEAAVLQELSAPPPPFDSDEFVMNEAEEAELPVDEAMLREIVRDVLREELQGRLGERITRNIRKLVRAEIARVMATDDLL